jgi:aspartate racemase
MTTKRIGLVGGLGPEATLEYYKGIINAFKSDNTSLNYPEIIIYSMNLSELIGMMSRKEYDRVIVYLLGAIDSLKKAGADFAAMGANSPHLVFDELAQVSPLPLISIVESAYDEVRRLGFQKPGLIGTAFTMSGTFYQDVFGKREIPIVLPEEPDMKIINEKLFSEIELGIFKNETRDLLVRIIDKMVQNQHIDCLILGCTEFPLILTETLYAGIPMLNTTQLHIDAIVKYSRR